MMKNAERVTGTKKMFREKRFLQKKRLLAVLLLTEQRNGSSRR